jgi:prolyl oligopeptidase
MDLEYWGESMHWLTRTASVLGVLGLAGAMAAPPPAKVLPFSQTFYGMMRSDPYHWMEAGGAPLDEYIRGQSAYTTTLLHDNPGRAKVVAALHDAFTAAGTGTTTSGVTRVGSRVFYLQSLPGSAEPTLLVRADGQQTSSVIVNAKTLTKGTVIGWFEPSPGGTKIAYGVTASSENVVIHVCNSDGTHDVAQAIDSSVIPDATWHGDRSFYYSTIRTTPTNRIEESFLHVVGAARGTDIPIAGFGAPGPLGSHTATDIFTTYSVVANDAVVAMIQHDVTPHKALFVAPFSRATKPNAPWRRLFGFDDQIVAAAVAGNYAYGLTDRGDARRTILIRDRRTGATVRTIAPHGSAFLTDIFANRTGVYVIERTGAASRIEHLSAAGRSLGNVALPTANIIHSYSSNPASDTFAVETSSYSDPSRWYEVIGAKAAVRAVRISPPPPAMYAHVRYANAVATSTDGTVIPYTVIYRAGTPKDGHRPTIIIGYGSYGDDVYEPPVPAYAAALADLGVVLVLAHPRGGGEFGEPWHLAGKGPTKQHTIDDFVACAHAVLDSGWTEPVKLAGWGASAGGITIGGAITQHPQLFAVAISQVGFNDMVDYESMPNGPGNVPEFGSAKTPNGFHDLLAMSAYDHVVPAPYPATILTTGFNDPRTAPWQVAKMAARLQASTTSGKPVLLRADAQGHGVVQDASAEIEEYADVWTFMLWQLGEPGFSPK